MNQYKRLLSNTFIFAVGTFSSKILVILMLRFYTGVLTQDEMGVADLIIKTTSILYPVVSLSIGQAVIRYGLERRRRKHDVFTIGLLTVACGFLIALPFNPLLKLVHYNTSAGVNGSLLDYRFLIYLYVLTSCTQNVCGQFIRALGYVRLYAIDGIFRTFTTIVLNILYLKVFQWNIFGYVFSIICSDALSTVCLFAIAKLWKYFRPRRLNFYLWRGMLVYALPLVPDAILVYIIGFSDQAFLASMQNTSVSAIYSIAYRVPTLIALVASIFIDAWQLSMVNNNTKDEQIEFFSTVGNTYSAIVFIIASGGIMCAKLAMTVLAVKNYYIGWTFIPILAIGAGFNCLSSFQKSVYLLDKKTVPSFLSALRRNGRGSRDAHQLCRAVHLPRTRQPPVHADPLEGLPSGAYCAAARRTGGAHADGAAALAHLAAAAVRCGRSAGRPRADGSVHEAAASSQQSVKRTKTKALRSKTLRGAFLLPCILPKKRKCEAFACFSAADALYYMACCSAYCFRIWK